MKMIRWLKKLVKLALLCSLGLVILTVGCYHWISYQSKDQITSDINDITPAKAAMVLGTSKRVRGGSINLFFKYRMQAVKKLFDHNKVQYIIVSGDNALKEYNESRDMKKYLIKLGIPEDRIVEDFAGFSTLDSVVRTKEVFGQDEIIIVSQPFHNERAIFIANHYDIDAIGFNAQAVEQSYSIKTHLREYLARVKCIIDVYILHTMPKYYKEKEVFPS